MATHATARQQADSAGENVMEGLQSMGATAKKMATDSYGAVRDRAGEYYEQGMDKARECSEAVQNQVREQPMKAVAIAAAVGFVFGLILARR